MELPPADPAHEQHVPMQPHMVVVDLADPAHEHHVPMNATAIEHGPANNQRREPYAQAAPAEPRGFFLHDHGLRMVDLADLKGLKAMPHHLLAAAHFRWDGNFDGKTLLASIHNLHWKRTCRKEFWVDSKRSVAAASERATETVFSVETRKRLRDEYDSDSSSDDSRDYPSALR